MYNVSSAYLTAARATSKTDNIYGTLTFSDGTTQDLTESDFALNSISITKQAVDEDELSFGSAIMGELDISLRTDTDRYAFFGARISLTYQLKVGGTVESPVWEDVPLGTYNVDESKRSGSVVSLVCYDDMSKFDTDIGSAVYYGTAYQILLGLCTSAGVELGSSQATITSYPNSDELVQIDPDSSCKTLRGAIKILCQMMGCFAEVGRDGKLYINQFSSSVTATLSKSDRYSSSIADYSCAYVSLEVTGLQGTFTAVTSIIRTGLTMIMDDAPAWDYGLEETLQNRVDNLMDYLENITYTPSELEMPGDPAFDCGDRLKLTISDEDDYVETLITEYTWTYHNPMQISSVGTNPYLEGTRTGDSSANRLLDQESKGNTITIYSITNTDDVAIANNSRVEIGSCMFAAKKSTSALFVGFIQVDVASTNTETKSISTNATFVDENGNEIPVTGTMSLDKPMDVTVDYVLGDDLQLPVYSFTEHLDTGKHAIPLFYSILTVNANTIYKWHVFITAEGGSVTVDEYDLKAALFGQNLVASGDSWDGTVEVYESMSITAPTLSMTELVSASTHVPLPSTVSEVISLLYPQVNMTEGYSIAPIGVCFSYQENLDYIITDCSTSDEKGWIGAGTLQAETAGIVYISLDLATTGFSTIELHQNVLGQYQISFDDGTTWQGYSGSSWITDMYMNGTQLQAITASEWTSHNSIKLKVTLESASSLRQIYLVGGRINA